MNVIYIPLNASKTILIISNTTKTARHFSSEYLKKILIKCPQSINMTYFDLKLLWQLLYPSLEDMSEDQRHFWLISDDCLLLKNTKSQLTVSKFIKVMRNNTVWNVISSVTTQNTHNESCFLTFKKRSLLPFSWQTFHLIETWNFH